MDKEKSIRNIINYNFFKEIEHNLVQTLMYAAITALLTQHAILKERRCLQVRPCDLL